MSGTQEEAHKKNRNDLQVMFCVFALIITSILGLVLTSGCTLGSSAGANTQVVIDPTFAELNAGDTVTLTINATNIPELFGWQVALKYNGTIVNCTGVEIPSSEDVFSKRRQEDQFKPIDVGPEFGNDTRDMNQWLLIGSQCITESVAVTNGILFRANFTALKNGDTTILIATKTNPVYFSDVDWDRYYTFLIDTSSREEEFASQSATVAIGGGNAKPIAIITGAGPQIDNASKYVLYGHKPVGDVQFIQSFKDYPVFFNASESYDPNKDGSITSYIWNFGDGNITSTTVPSIVHVFTNTGIYTVRLTVKDNGQPPLESDPSLQLVVTGMVMDYVDWSPLLYAIIAVVAIVVTVTLIRRIRTRRPSQ